MSTPSELERIKERVRWARALNDEAEQAIRARRLDVETRELAGREAALSAREQGDALVVLAMCADALADPSKEPSAAFDSRNVGRRVKVWWEAERRWFRGVIVQVSNVGAKVKYDDQDVQWETDVTLLSSQKRHRPVPLDSRDFLTRRRIRRTRFETSKLGVDDGWGVGAAKTWSS